MLPPVLYSISPETLGMIAATALLVGVQVDSTGLLLVSGGAGVWAAAILLSQIRINGLR